MRWLALVTAFAGATDRARAQAETDDVVGWARNQARTFHPATEIARGFEGLGSLAERVAGVRLLGVGESLHNVHEFLLFRNSLLRELAERHQVTAVALESGLPEAQAIDAYVSGRTDTIDWSTALGYGLGGFEEVRQAVEWLRAWNREPGHKPIRVYGVDLPSSAGSMLPALTNLLAYLDRVDQRRAASIRTGLTPLAERVSDAAWQPAVAKYQRLTVAARDSLRRAAAALGPALRTRRARYIKASSPDDYEWALAMARLSEQFEMFLRLGPYHPANPREVVMAENTRWVLAREGPSARVVLWAHNAHVQAVPIGGPASPAKVAVPSMGSMLRRSLGGAYQAIGFSYGGAPNDSTPDPASIDGVLRQVGIERFWLDLAEQPAPAAVASWLRAPQLIRFQGIGYLLVAPRAAFTYLVYFDRITMAVEAPRPPS